MSSDLKSVENLEQRCIAAIESQNWTDKPLTEEEKHLIGMAVDWTVHVLKAEVENK